MNCQVLSPTGKSCCVLGRCCLELLGRVVAVLHGSMYQTWHTTFANTAWTNLAFQQLFSTRDSILSPSVSHKCQRAFAKGCHLLLPAAPCSERSPCAPFWNLRIRADWKACLNIVLRMVGCAHLPFYCMLQENSSN